MSWLSVTLHSTAGQAERLTDALMEVGALSVSIEDAAAGSSFEKPVFGEPGSVAHELWPDCQVVCLFDPKDDAHALLARAAKRADFVLSRYCVQCVPEQDWVRLTQAEFKPVCVADRLWIVPSWHVAPDPSAINIQLDPGLAFGTGSHATTRLCLDWLVHHLATGMSVVDYGCGSGILAIAAAKLGAQPVYGIDIDPQAVLTALDNAERNGVEAGFFLPESDPGATGDILVANILTNPLLALAPLLTARCRIGGQLVLSGILVEQVETIQAAYRPWLDLTLWADTEGWVCLHGTRMR